MQQNWFYRLERKFGKYRIPGLMRYIVAIEIAGALLGIVFPSLYWQYLMLDFNAVFRGQIWRLVTFVFYPEVSLSDLSSIIIFAIKVSLYYWVGNTLENTWGSFRFTCYFISGILMSVFGGLILYIATLSIGGVPWVIGFEYINLSMFLAFAVLFPDVEFLIYFIIPVKAKWLGIFDAVLLGVNIVLALSSGDIRGLAVATSIVVSMLNFIIFFLITKNPRQRAKVVKRKREFERQMGPKVVPLYRHRCAVCGRTERDNENLEFRFCSKCEGNFEYCSDHIYTHEHVKKMQD